MCVCAQSCPTLHDPMDCGPPGSSVHGILLEYWSGLPFPPPEDLPDPGIKPTSLLYPALAGGFFNTALPGKPTDLILYTLYSTYCIKVYCVLAYMVQYIIYIVYAA